MLRWHMCLYGAAYQAPIWEQWPGPERSPLCENSGLCRSSPQFPAGVTMELQQKLTTCFKEGIWLKVPLVKASWCAFWHDLVLWGTWFGDESELIEFCGLFVGQVPLGPVLGSLTLHLTLPSSLSSAWLDLGKRNEEACWQPATRCGAMSDATRKQKRKIFLIRRGHFGETTVRFCVGYRKKRALGRAWEFAIRRNRIAAVPSNGEQIVANATGYATTDDHPELQCYFFWIVPVQRRLDVTNADIISELQALSSPMWCRNVISIFENK